MTRKELKHFLMQTTTCLLMMIVLALMSVPQFIDKLLGLLENQKRDEKE